ncbi:50S ribosomal protein L16 [Chitinivibrio alkaliphilus]|uniref:Large ribosomal subunit protein uL16 n=1 Tax=Chitinivibrio alkaliphilus ACht1 TaxID=1313304 RepID=U7D6V2_9BACT|nr:50S ribosomal protein L16 [Chitinivibrio alkaliphilus]ERP31296.1 50S ribosomal protein L16 [Chitinivibrio alkaliphilus ACht1]
MLSPKKVKWRKQQRGRMRGKASRGNRVSFGEYGIQALECGWITSQQIEACRVTIMRTLKRGAKLWIRVFPHKSVTATAAETRMGKGKGSPEYWVAVVKPGTMMFELAGASHENSTKALKLAMDKLPIKAQFVKNENS